MLRCLICINSGTRFCRVHLFSQEERNTKFFHKIAKIKCTNKSITIHEDDLVYDPDDIEKLLVNFSERIFNNMDTGIIDDYIPYIVDNIMNAMLTNLPSSEEVNQAIF